MSEILRTRLSWIEPMRLSLLRALGDDIIDPNIVVNRTTDPLTVFMKIRLLHRLNKKTRKPIRVFIREWAEHFNCVVRTIDIKDHMILAQILIKHRHWKQEVEDGPDSWFR